MLLIHSKNVLSWHFVFFDFFTAGDTCLICIDCGCLSKIVFSLFAPCFFVGQYSWLWILARQSVKLFSPNLALSRHCQYVIFTCYIMPILQVYRNSLYAMYVNNDKILYFVSFGVEFNLEEIKKMLRNKYITRNICKM